MRQPRKTFITTIRMTPYQEEKVKEIALTRKTDVSDVIRYALDLFIDEFLLRRKSKKMEFGNQLSPNDRKTKQLMVNNFLNCNGFFFCFQ